MTIKLFKTQIGTFASVQGILTEAQIQMHATATYGGHINVRYSIDPAFMGDLAGVRNGVGGVEGDGDLRLSYTGVKSGPDLARRIALRVQADTGFTGEQYPGNKHGAAHVSFAGTLADCTLRADLKRVIYQHALATIKRAIDRVNYDALAWIGRAQQDATAVYPKDTFAAEQAAVEAARAEVRAAQAKLTAAKAALHRVAVKALADGLDEMVAEHGLPETLLDTDAVRAQAEKFSPEHDVFGRD